MNSASSKNARPRLVLLATSGGSTDIVFNALRREWDEIHVVLEERISRVEMVKRRIKKLGRLTVAGQIAFLVAVEPFLQRRGRRRIRALQRKHHLDTTPIGEGQSAASITHVPSANDPITKEVLQRLAPDLVIVNGTRIIRADVLECIPARFINTHYGITPAFRGVHGGYWAMAANRPDMAGTTVHFVDAGIDTGGIIKQATFTATRSDSFATYPTLHQVVGVPMLIEAICEVLVGEVRQKVVPCDLPSTLRSHPTIWGYWAARWRNGAR